VEFIAFVRRLRPKLLEKVHAIASARTSELRNDVAKLTERVAIISVQCIDREWAKYCTRAHEDGAVDDETQTADDQCGVR
jgi:hypothetical protein